MATYPTSAVNEKESSFTDGIFSIVLNKVPDWIKWIILFPISIFVFGLVYEIFFVVIKAAFKEIFSWNTPLAIQIAQVLPIFFGSFMYIKSGYSIAPKYKKRTSLILLILIGLIMVVSIFNIIAGNEEGRYFDFFKCLVISLGSFIGYYNLPSQKDLLRMYISNQLKKAYSTLGEVGRNKIKGICIEYNDAVSKVDYNYPEFSKQEKENQIEQYIMQMQNEINDVYTQRE
ncbi:MAG: hypothetical protein P4L35_03655 [Ignavibacteriaceae bacterium]|nr:hypothetical protein [Ignavibacteriaceae bacterium]